MQDLLTGKQSADHRGHPLWESVVSDGEASGAVSWQTRNAATAVLNVANAVSPPLQVSPRQCNTCTCSCH